MRVEIFCLCDAAVESLGKLNILGAFDTFFVPQIPMTCPQCSVALRMRFGLSEIGKHNVVVSFVDVDGRHVIKPAEGVLNINAAGSANLILNLQGLTLAKLGEYAIDLLVDGKNEGTLPLFVKLK